MERISAEVGYCIEEDYRSEGIMFVALASAAENYFSITEVIRLYVMPFSPAKIR